MSSDLGKFSLFYYGHTVTSDNQNIDFKEGVPELTAVLEVGDYSLEEYADEVKRALDAAGALTYTVTVNRTTRALTISAGSNFSLLTNSGSHAGTSAFSMMGFSGADKTGASTYTGSTGSGSVYAPQFKLQDYRSSASSQKAVESTVHRSGSGKVQAVNFGTEKLPQARIRFATNIPQIGTAATGIIKNNLTGVQDLQTFMQYITTKAKFEFIPDENAPGTYETWILESTEENQQGTGYELRERYDIGLPGYFETSLLRFRVVEV